MNRKTSGLKSDVFVFKGFVPLVKIRDLRSKSVFRYFMKNLYLPTTNNTPFPSEERKDSLWQMV